MPESLFASAAADAVGCLSFVLGMYLMVVVVGVPVMVDIFGVHAGEQIRNGNMLRTTGNAITACRAGNHFHGVQYPAHVADRLQFLFIQRAELLHVGEIVVDLREIAHAGERHEHAVAACGKTYGITAGLPPFSACS